MCAYKLGIKKNTVLKMLQ